MFSFHQVIKSFGKAMHLDVVDEGKTADILGWSVVLSQAHQAQAPTEPDTAQDILNCFLCL